MIFCNKQNIVLIDEVQMCENFEKAINWIHAEERYDIYITGSNAFLLSSDLATLFTGRTFEIEIYPFSFEEFSRYYDYDDLNESFDKYVLEGGMAGSYLYKTNEEKYLYLKDIYNALVIRDIKQRYKIRNTKLLDELSDFLMDNILNITSSRSIARALTKDKKMLLVIKQLIVILSIYVVLLLFIKLEDMIFKEKILIITR